MRRFALVLTVLLIGCGEYAPPSADLVARFTTARLGTDTGLIDFGVPAGRPYLLSGFGLDEQGTAWGLGTESIVEFHLSAPRDLPLVASCMPFTYPDAPVQTVTFELNGHPGPRVELAAGMANYQVRLPAAATRRGWNRLVLRYAWARPPFAVLASSADRRPLAVAWDFMLFEDDLPGPRQPPVADAAAGTLTVPPGTSISYYVSPPPGARLALEEVSFAARPRSSVTVVLEGDGGRAERLAVLRRPLRAWEIPLPHGWSGPLRLSFEADGGTVRLVRPRLVGSGAAARAAVAETLPPRRPNVLVYLVDTLRADRLGCYGHDRPTSPRTDALARDGIVFTDTMAESSWTRSTVASLFTGLSPRRHAVYGRFDALAEGTTTLAGLLRDAGYETAGFLTNGNVDKTFGLGQGFDRYELLPGAIVPGAAGIVTEPLPRSNNLDAWAQRWLRTRDATKPFFLYLHAADPHGPYLPPARFRRRLGVPESDAKVGNLWRLQDLHAHRVPVLADTAARLFGVYDAEIAHNDHYFGRLLAELKRRGLYDDLLIVFVADHGEEFHEHGGWEHGQTLYGEVLNIPLIVKLPGGAHAGRRVERPAQLADLLPTILAQLGLDAPPTLDGVDLLGGLDDPPPATPREQFAHLDLDGYVADSIATGSWKLVMGWTGNELFDRRTDPAERTNVIAAHLETAGYLRARLEERIRRTTDAPRRAATVPDDVLENLRALGYVH